MLTKDTSDFSNIDFNSGEVILIDKPAEWTSFKIVHRIRKTVGVKKVGHAGTLDPLATGLLIVCTGKKTKEIYKYQNLNKTYSGTITLGKRSASMDLGSEVIEEKPVVGIDENKILEIRDSFLGKISQIPPMYSALKVDGKRLYDLARKGKTVEREPREVNIEEFKIEDITLPDIKFTIVCSKGTYIRVIADDFGNKLGCGALLSSLRRTKIGDYSVDNAFEIDEFISGFNEITKIS